MASEVNLLAIADRVFPGRFDEKLGIYCAGGSRIRESGGETPRLEPTLASRDEASRRAGSPPINRTGGKL
jgi:hypothetical protein